VAKVSLKKYAEDFPAHHNPKKAFLDQDEMKELVEEAVQGIRDGISPTVASKWLISESPLKINIKFHTIRMYLSNRAKEIS
jgi:UDP-N-acetyl-D-mannosaminuronic acid transferase (WecB/TagA/CpsF family)